MTNMRAAVAVVGIAVGVIGLSGCESPVVGGSCLGGFSACSGRCVDLSRNDRHCGACGHACPHNSTCLGGTCLGPGSEAGMLPVDAGRKPDGDLIIDEHPLPDGALPEGGRGDAMPGPNDGGGLDGGGNGNGSDDGGPGGGDGGPGDGDAGPGGDGGVPSCDIGETSCGGTCVNPDTDPNHCGGCGQSCDPGFVCSDGECNPVCDASLTFCGGICVDAQTDADHCGGCGESCESGICRAGDCVVGAVGHVVVVGHDYASSRPGMNRVAGNAVFLGRGAPVDTVVYEGDARGQAVQGVDGAIDQVASVTGRSWDRIEATRDEVTLELAQADTFVIYAQQSAADEKLRQLGTQWATALESFVQRGGVVVLFEGAGTSNQGTYQILDAAGLFSADSRTEISGDNLDVVAPGDAVAVNVPRQYRAEDASVWFEAPDGRAVVAHSEGPVVLHDVRSN